MTDKFILFPYYMALKIRHAMYDKGILHKVKKAEMPTICLGNVTVGGTGKTPHAEMILRTLLMSEEWGAKSLAVLSRGYKRASKGFQQVTLSGSARDCGDEPLQIKKKFPAVTVAVDRDRVEGCDFLAHPEKLQTARKARRCKEKDMQKADLVLLDDAYQYRALKADVNIVLMDYSRPVWSDHLMPLGHLRDLPERIEKADIIIVTKCPHSFTDWDKTMTADALGLRGYSAATCTGINRKGRTQGIYFTRISYLPMVPLYPEADQRYVYSKKLILFSGIANDTSLRRFLSDRYHIVKRYSFADHHAFSQRDIKNIAAASKACPVAALATTEKDAQRVLDCPRVPDSLKLRLFHTPIEVTFLSDGERDVFRETLLAKLRQE